MERIKKLEKVKPFHLSISYDSTKDEIIYDRLLKEGSGDNIYGITVARHIIHDKEFIDMALEIKNELLETPEYCFNPAVKDLRLFKAEISSGACDNIRIFTE